jgi:hypothetical protein
MFGRPVRIKIHCQQYKAPTDTTAPGEGGGVDKLCRILNFAVPSFGMDFLLPTEGSIPDSCNEIWE